LDAIQNFGAAHDRNLKILKFLEALMDAP